MKTEAEIRKALEDIEWFLRGGHCPTPQLFHYLGSAVATLEWLLEIKAPGGLENPIAVSLENVRLVRKNATRESN